VFSATGDPLYTAIMEVKFPNSITRIGDYALSRSMINSVTIPENVTEIEAWSF
jgi:hypothetical protein